MSSPGTHRLRLVIQRVEEGYPPRSTYRLLAYPAPSGLTLRPAKFQSREEVVTRLQEAVPGFDPARLGTGLQTQIIFAEDVELNEAQLVALGVTDSPGTPTLNILRLTQTQTVIRVNIPAIPTPSNQTSTPKTWRLPPET